MTYDLFGLGEQEAREHLYKEAFATDKKTMNFGVSGNPSRLIDLNTSPSNTLEFCMVRWRR
jgi:hypothetical protein